MKFYYLVFVGKNPGVYQSWDECVIQVHKYSGAKYKKVKANSLEDAWRIFNKIKDPYLENINKAKNRHNSYVPREDDIYNNFLSVDGASNYKHFEFRGVWVDSKEVAFASPKYEGGTSNIAEFLGLVEGCKFLIKEGLPINIYTDSLIAIGWFRKQRVRTKAAEYGLMTPQIEFLLEESKVFLQENESILKDAIILKWETKDWGEIPADYGRKNKNKF